MKPILQALVLADYVYDDKATGKKVIAGTFSQFTIVRHAIAAQPSEEGPSQQPQKPGVIMPVGSRAGAPWVYISLTDIKGAAELVLRYVDLKTNNALMGAKCAVTCPNPLQTVELVIPLPELPMPHPGVYAIELLCEDEPLGSLRVTVKEITHPPVNPNPPSEP